VEEEEEEAYVLRSWAEKCRGWCGEKIYVCRTCGCVVVEQAAVFVLVTTEDEGEGEGEDANARTRSVGLEFLKLPRVRTPFLAVGMALGSFIVNQLGIVDVNFLNHPQEEKGELNLSVIPIHTKEGI
jgi:hypothetical protein